MVVVVVVCWSSGGGQCGAEGREMRVSIANRGYGRGDTVGTVVCTRGYCRIVYR